MKILDIIKWGSKGWDNLFDNGLTVEQIIEPTRFKNEDNVRVRLDLTIEELKILIKTLDKENQL